MPVYERCSKITKRFVLISQTDNIVYKYKFNFNAFNVIMFLTLGEERRLRVFKNRVLRGVFGPKRVEVTGEWGNFIMLSLMICIPHPLLCGG
jgi:hypothetical protein